MFFEIWYLFELELMLLKIHHADECMYKCLILQRVFLRGSE